MGDGPAERVGQRSASGRRWRRRGSRRCRTGGPCRVSRPAGATALPDGAVTAVVPIVDRHGRRADRDDASSRPAGWPVTGTSCGPGLEPGDVEVHDQGRPGQPVEVGRRAADRDQDAVDRQRVGQVVAGADQPEPGTERAGRRSPGRILIETRDRCLVRPPRRRSAGRARPRRSRRPRRPSAGPARCPRVPAAASWSASPATSATCGSTVTDSISKPAAGSPVTIGLTGRVRLLRSEKTGIVTRAVAGVTSTGTSALPSLSTGTSWTSWSTSIPADWIDDVGADGSRPVEIDDAAPETVTVSGSTVTSPRVSPSGTGPWTTLTGTSARVSSPSSSTVANCGLEAEDGDPGVERLVTSIGTLEDAAWSSIPGQVDGRQERAGGDQHAARREVADLR